MDRGLARLEAESILGDALATQVTNDDWERALDAAVTVDPDGHLPGDDDWQPSYEPHWAAAEAVEALALRSLGTGGQVAKFTSEGASFEMTPPSLHALAARLRAKSPISTLTNDASGIGWVDVDRSPLGYQPTSGQAWI